MAAESRAELARLALGRASTYILSDAASAPTSFFPEVLNSLNTKKQQADVQSKIVSTISFESEALVKQILVPRYLALTCS